MLTKTAWATSARTGIPNGVELGKIASALLKTNLRFAVEHELPAETRQGLEKLEDLKSLHGDPRFDALLASSRQRTAAVPTSH
jgi:hypothetical protein